jgi:hypothetical protein
MAERRTQSYAAVPAHVRDDIATGIRIRRAHVREAFADPEDFEPELPPSPTFWPRDEPKEQPTR